MSSCHVRAGVYGDNEVIDTVFKFHAVRENVALSVVAAPLQRDAPCRMTSLQPRILRDRRCMIRRPCHRFQGSSELEDPYCQNGV